jgi:hypothetical protein
MKCIYCDEYIPMPGYKNAGLKCFKLGSHSFVSNEDGSFHSISFMNNGTAYHITEYNFYIDGRFQDKWFKSEEEIKRYINLVRLLG